jgi:hypothetical protein
MEDAKGLINDRRQAKGRYEKALWVSSLVVRNGGAPAKGGGVARLQPQQKHLKNS